MFIRYVQVLSDPGFKTSRIDFPGEVMQVYTHGVKANGFSPTQFTIDGCSVEGLGLPHLQLIDCRTGNKIASSKPSNLLIPLTCLLFCPNIPCRRYWYRCLNGGLFFLP